MTSDLHVHTNFCDGKSSPREIVMSAIKKGVDTLGFSGHSYFAFDEDTCMSRANTEKYFAEINSLKEEFKDKIRILCGIEQEYFSAEPTDRYDYVIGSVHYFHLGDEYLAVDLDAETLRYAADTYFGGDIYALCEEYYRLEGDVANRIKPDIIGHFDLITKFNEAGQMFDESHPRYIAAWKKAADSLLKYNIPFEIYSGAISRGYRTAPYPAPSILEYIKENGGCVVINSDSHHKDTLCYEFKNSCDIAEKCGVKIFDANNL